jgi:hypothetical protein
MAATRTDVHSPTNLVTEHYEFGYAYDSQGPRNPRALQALLDQGYRFGQVHGGETCDHCGARLRYVAVLLHTPTRTLIKVGEQCLDNRFSLATAEFQSLRKAATLNRERTTRAAKVAALVDANPVLAWLTYPQAWEDSNDAGTLSDMAYKMERYADLSERQVAYVASMLDRYTRYCDTVAARKAADDAAKADGSMTPAPTGRVVVTGTVVKTAWKDNGFGGAWKMTVKADGGYRVYGTVPAALDGVEAGARVEFTATLEQAADDQYMAWAKRPSKARVLEG